MPIITDAHNLSQTPQKREIVQKVISFFSSALFSSSKVRTLPAKIRKSRIMIALLQHRYFAVGAALVVVGLFPFFFLSGPSYYDPRSFHAFWDMGHVGFYACLSCCLVLYYPPLKNRNFWQQLAVIMAFALISGLAIELIQSRLNRSPHIGDMMRNLVGAYLALTFCSKAASDLSALQQWALRSLAIILVAVAAQPFADNLLKEHDDQLRLPVLASFEQESDLQRFTARDRLTLVDKPTFAGNAAMQVEFKAGTKYTGFSLRYAPKDWSEFKRVSVQVYNPSNAVQALSWRLHDKHHNNQYEDRFNQTVQLSPGWNQMQLNLRALQLESGRTFDLANIAALGFFMSELEEKEFLIFDEFRLHP